MLHCFKSKVPCENHNSKQCQRMNWLRLLKTVLLVLTYIGWGMANSIAFAAVPDLRVRMDTTVEGMSYAFSLGALGSVVSTPLGVFADRIGSYSGLILGLCLGVTSLSNILKPYSTTIWYYGVCEFTDIIGWSLMCNVSNSLLILMWGQEGRSPLHAMHLGYPIGAAIGGQIARAFVSKNSSEVTTPTGQNSSLQGYMENVTTIITTYGNKRFLDESRIEIGFIIIACFILALGILFMIFQFIGKKEIRRNANKRSYSWKEILHPSKWGAGDATFALALFTLFVLFQVAVVGCDKGMAQYLATYSVDSDLGFSNQEAATLTSFYYLLDGAGLFACIFIAKKMSLKSMVLLEVHGMTILALLLMIFGTKHKISLYILASLFSLFKGPAFASMYAWPDYYITLLSTILAVAHIIRSVLDVFMTAFQGYLYTNTVIESIFYTTFGYGSFMCVLIYVVYYVTWNKPGRHEPENMKEMTVSANRDKLTENEDQDIRVAFL